MSQTIDYGNLMHDAMRGLIKKILLDVQNNGLPGAHHFYITFDTSHPDAELADWLYDRYPNEMTLVIQHWFDNLEVSDEGFKITLNFGDSPEPLYVPYDALLTFVDPSVEFGLRFENMSQSDEEGSDTSPVPLPERETSEETQPSTDKDAEIVSLDSFRK